MDGLRKVLRGKIHRATVTQAELDYVGSITIDRDLMDAAGLLPNEAVIVADINNGSRHETYAIPGPRASGVICVNGAAARLVSVGDKVIVFAFAMMTPEEASSHKAKVVLVNDDNTIKSIIET